MITNSFIHLKGIGRQSEQTLWKKGIKNWDDYIKSNDDQYSLFGTPTIPSNLKGSINALRCEDMKFFAEAFHPTDYYRIALAFPQDVMFLDIETTGLSCYYDIITIIGWSTHNIFGVYINGQDDSLFREALANAKVLVTFNGTMFDIKFIKKYINNVAIPPVHIDLRFFAKRVGLTGGQKSIEKQLGISRKKNIEDMQGEAAPILWHKYRRGDNTALKRLIEYNHADVEGMKTILDTCIDRIFKKEKIPSKFYKKKVFSKMKSKILWANHKNTDNSYNIFIESFNGSTKPLITFKDLNGIKELQQLTVIGIDLVSSELRETGFSILKGNQATTCRVKTDEEMIRLATKAKANLISIDSPLSIPKGRTTFWDDDPAREQYGITRECERILKRRGISSYPCLIQSMQKLTKRGIELATKFRKLGIPVIESYPGAAQDIMSIPRKQAGLAYLIEGLKEFGIRGPFTELAVSHDELDAITSAIVGLFFWVGKFEALGNSDEEYLIIPDLNANHHNWLHRKVIGISGPICSGKTTVSHFLQEHGFKYTRFSLVLQQLLEKQETPITRSELQNLGAEINKNKGQRWLASQVIQWVGNASKIVIDGLRHPEDHAFMLESFGPAYTHVYIDCSKDIREKRFKLEHREDICFQAAISHQAEKDVPKMKKLASYNINNDSSIIDLKENANHIR